MFVVLHFFLYLHFTIPTMFLKSLNFACYIKVKLFNISIHLLRIIIINDYCKAIVLFQEGKTSHPDLFGHILHDHIQVKPHKTTALSDAWTVSLSGSLAFEWTGETWCLPFLWVSCQTVFALKYSNACMVWAKKGLMLPFWQHWQTSTTQLRQSS